MIMKVFESSRLLVRPKRIRTRAFYAPQVRAFLPYTDQLLTEGGDDRICIDNETDTNSYGCARKPDSELLPFGSSTASTISAHAFASVDSLRRELTIKCGAKKSTIIYQQEMDRIRRELIAICDLTDFQGLETIFAASGTDIHLIASQLIMDSKQPLLSIAVDSSETGSKVSAALAGQHFNSTTALGIQVSQEIAKEKTSSDDDCVIISLREENGALRNSTVVDDEVEQLIANAVAQGKQVLLTLVDVSKTGLIAPSVDCAIALKKRFPENVTVLADCCQGRISTRTLRQYVLANFLVAMTGSKFLGGPSFSGVLFVPPTISRQMEPRTMSPMLKQYCARGEWPSRWSAGIELTEKDNLGLLLRWHAALEEWRAFKSVPEKFVLSFLKGFDTAMKSRLQSDENFEIMPTYKINRGKTDTVESWDQVQTIFPFILFRLGSEGQRKPLSREQTHRIYESMPDATPSLSATPLRCQIGQPIPCGYRAEIPVSALRLCVGARTIVEAYKLGPTMIISQAQSVLDKVSWLAQN